MGGQAVEAQIGAEQVGDRKPTLGEPAEEKRKVTLRVDGSVSSPGATPAVHRTAPTPVATAHPTSAAWSSETPSGIGTTASARTTAWVAKQPVPSNRPSGAPSSTTRSTGTSRGCSHSCCEPETHRRHLRQGIFQQSSTGVPSSPGSAPGPTASTTPAPSCPRSMGTKRASLTAARSVWQTPAARIQILTSSGPGPPTAMSSITGRPPCSRRTRPRQWTEPVTVSSRQSDSWSASRRRSRRRHWCRPVPRRPSEAPRPARASRSRPRP